MRMIEALAIKGNSFDNEFLLVSFGTRLYNTNNISSARNRNGEAWCAEKLCSRTSPVG